jgi:hypothetical protein
MTFLRQIIDEHEKKMLQDIEKFQIEENQLIEKYKKELENQLNYFDLQKKIFNLFISINDQIRLLKNKSEFFVYINQTSEILDKLQRPIGIDYNINGLGQLQNLKEQILQCAKVTESSKTIMQFSVDEKPQIEKLITLQEVNLNGQSLTDQNMHMIVEILEKNTVRTYLIISY